MHFILRLQQMRAVFFLIFFMKSEGTMRLYFIMFLATLFLLVLSYKFITLFIWLYVLCKPV